MDISDMQISECKQEVMSKAVAVVSVLVVNSITLFHGDITYICCHHLLDLSLLCLLQHHPRLFFFTYLLCEPIDHLFFRTEMAVYVK